MYFLLKEILDISYSLKIYMCYELARICIGTKQTIAFNYRTSHKHALMMLCHLSQYRNTNQ